MPSIDSISSEEQQDMSYTATFEVFPEVENLELESIEIEKPTVEITDADSMPCSKNFAGTAQDLEGNQGSGQGRVSR